MKHNLRNSLVLLGLLLMIVITRFVIGYSMNKKIKAMNDVLVKNKTEWQALQGVEIDTMQVFLVRMKIAETENWVNQYGKYFIKEDNTRETWNYLNNIVNNYCPELQFNFESNQTNVAEELTNFSYKITGIAEMENLYTFITHIEKQPALYTVERLSLEYYMLSEEKKNTKHLVNFEFNLVSWLSPVGRPVRELSFRNNFADQIASNAFSPKIHPFFIKTEEEPLIKTDNLILISLTPQKAFVKNNDNKVYILVPGSKVAYGHLASINWSEQSITFKINKIGVNQDVKIYLTRD